VTTRFPALEDLDLITQEMLIDHAGELKKLQWFVRAHLENAGGKLADTEKGAASAAKRKSR
jgi:starvation-inducible DNA-binding protein